MITFLYFLALAFFILLCIVLSFVILIQESKSTGLGASFGGDTSDSLFGTSTADVLKKFTAWLSAIFFAACVLLSLWTSALSNSKQSISSPSSYIEQPEE